MNQVSSGEVSTETTQLENASDSMMGNGLYPQQLELPANINISDGRLVMANGESVQITTDPASESLLLTSHFIMYNYD